MIEKVAGDARRQFVRIAGGLIALLGVGTLIGWLLGLSALTGGFSNWPRMAPLTATAFLLAGLGLAASQAGAGNREGIVSNAWQFLPQFCAGAVAVIGILRLGAYAAGWDLGIDGLGISAASLSNPPRMAPGTAANFAILGSALWLAQRPYYTRLFQILGLTGLLIGWLGFSRYFYGGDPLLPFLQMAIPTTLGFIVLAAGVLFTRVDGGVAALLASDEEGGAMARRLLLPAIVVPFLFGWLRLQGQRAGWFGTEAGLSLFALSNVALFGALVCASAIWLNRTDRARKQQEESLRESRQILESIVDNSPAVIYLKDLAGRYVLINRRYEELFHVSRAQHLGRTDYELFSNEAADAFRAVDNQVAAAGTPVEAEEVAPVNDQLRTFISVKFPVTDATGKLYAVGGVSTDITDRKLGEIALAASEQRTRLIVETALDSVIAMGGDGIIMDWNPQAERMFGWTRDEAMGRLLRDMIVPVRYREAHERGLQRYVETGQATVLGKRIEIQALHRDGREFPVELAITPIQSGSTVIFSAFVRDITERKQAEHKLRTQLARLDLLSHITRAIGERHDLQSIFQVVVRSLEDQFPVEFSCVCLYDPVAARLQAVCIGPKSQTLASDTKLDEKTHIAVDENGLSRCVRGELVYESDISPLAFAFPRRLSLGGLRSLVLSPLMIGKAVFGVLAVARRESHAFSSGDCEFMRQLSEHVALATHQMQLQDSLQRAYDDLRQTQQAVMQQEKLRTLGQMASGIAHDINNAISPVVLYVQSLRDDEPDLSPRARSYLETISRAIDDVAATVASMREVYRPRESESALSPVRLDELVRQVVEFTHARWSDMPQQRGIVIELSTELSSDAPAILGIESELREALINLVFNAVDAMPAGGRLLVRTRSSEPRSAASTASVSRQVHLEVVDSGIGMDEEARRRCLEPFYTTKGERGTGLGLAMVYGIAQRHSAEIEIDSELGKGTTFRLIFPVPNEASAAPIEASIIPLAPRDLNLLVIDDDPLVSLALSHILGAEGHTVTVAEGGKEGIAAFHAAVERGEPFEVVITDLGMPYVDGRKVASAVKRASPATPVVLLTGWGKRLAEGEEEIPPHVDYVLGKPPRIQDLREVLARCTHH